MEDIKKRAREILADVLLKEGYDNGTVAILREQSLHISSEGKLPTVDALKAIEAALTRPYGYVLVPVEPTDDEVRTANEAQQQFFDDYKMSCFFSSAHYNEESIRSALRKVRSDRKEVSK